MLVTYRQDAGRASRYRFPADLHSPNRLRDGQQGVLVSRNQFRCRVMLTSPLPAFARRQSAIRSASF
jgi:hypothetical protein